MIQIYEQIMIQIYEQIMIQIYEQFDETELLNKLIRQNY
jgi:hypothetical protein